MVKTNRSYSSDYNVERGVKQGSVLSPVLFHQCNYYIDIAESLQADSDGSSIEEFRRVRFWIILV